MPISLHRSDGPGGLRNDALFPAEERVGFGEQAFGRICVKPHGRGFAADVCSDYARCIEQNVLVKDDARRWTMLMRVDRSRGISRERR